MTANAPAPRGPGGASIPATHNREITVRPEVVKPDQTPMDTVKAVNAAVGANAAVAAKQLRSGDWKIIMATPTTAQQCKRQGEWYKTAGAGRLWPAGSRSHMSKRWA